MLGRNLGNYHVVSKIGEGGMGAVYLARHVTLGRPAAIKVLHSSLSSNQDMVSRFFNEARAATAVRNPGIVEVFDFGVVEDGSAYIVMEYLEGENLGARIRRGRMSVAATMTIVRAISRALHAAHEQGIVHRDLKPDNIFLVPDPELASGERVKLLDFGIAKLAPISGEVSQTRTGMVMGTPTYMAPEQCRGAGSVDHRADLYALGCVAYQMMCGRPPFVSDGAGDLIARHLYFAPEPLRSLCPDIPAKIDDLVLWLLQKDPAARPASAADLVRAIEQLAAESEVGVLQTHPPARFSAAGLAPITNTTLRGAASTVSLTGAPAQSPRRTGLIAGVAAGVVAVAAVLIVVVRGHHGDDDALTARVAGAAPEHAPAPAASPAPPSPAAQPAVSAATPPTPAAPAVAPPPAAAAPASEPLARPAAPPAAPAATVDRADRSSRADHKKHPSPSSRIAQRDPEPAAAAPAEPQPPAAAPAPSAPVAPPPVAAPPPAEPPRAVPGPAAMPAPTAPKAPPLVPTTAVTKRSGAIPMVKVNGAVGDSADVLVKLCIDEQGAVSSAKVVKAPPDVAGQLQRGLLSWRYEPYVNAAGVQSAACFPVSFRVVFKN
ncbi:MAG TPA: serine/threonine-protein kinase [Kofleriaceae bacterium]|jgi:serine/threonine-protein kinase|nr:serine/threonine-protein kinase [Kofleriaceae bacterium]